MQVNTISKITANPLAAAAITSSQAAHTKAKEAAKAFETIFTTMMMRSMRSAMQQINSDLVPMSTGEKIYTDMLDEQYGDILSSKGNLGLADLILKQIDKNPEQASGLNMLKGLKESPWMMDNKFIPSQSSTSNVKPQDLSAWQPYINEAGKKYGVDTSLIAAVIQQESAGDPKALSSKGAKGLMQLMDSTARDMGVSQSFHPGQNIMGGTKYLRQLLDKYKGNEQLALASYNAGSGAVDKYKGIPPYQETQNYVKNIAALKQHISKAKDGTDANTY